MVASDHILCDLAVAFMGRPQIPHSSFLIPLIFPLDIQTPFLFLTRGQYSDVIICVKRNITI